VHKIQTESIARPRSGSRCKDHENRDHENIARIKDQEDRDRNHDESWQENFIDKYREDKDRDKSRSLSRNHEGSFRDRSIHDRSSRSKSGSSDDISGYRSDNKSPDRDRHREHHINYGDDYRFNYRDRSPANYRDRSTDRYPQMSRGNNCSTCYSIVYKTVSVISAHQAQPITLLIV